jgi:hypothetical protein
MGVITIKGGKEVVECNEKLYLHYFEKPPSIVFNEIFVHLLELCSFTHEVEITRIWNHFIILEECFQICCRF